MKNGGKLVIETFIEDEYAIAKFTDNGTGMSEELAEKFGFHSLLRKTKIKPMKII